MLVGKSHSPRDGKVRDGGPCVHGHDVQIGGQLVGVGQRRAKLICEAQDSGQRVVNLGNDGLDSVGYGRGFSAF